MAKTEEPQTQLATRIPKERDARIVLRHFAAAAIEEKLEPKRGSKRI
jgi:hypothetical protein